MKTIKRYNACMKAKNLSEQKEYWLNEFKEEVPVLDIPIDYIRPKEESFKEAMIFRKIEKQLGEKINSTAGKTGTTEYMIFLSAAMITLSKYSRQEDIVIGSPISGRTHKHKDKHVNILAMRGRPKGNKEYIEFLQEIKESCIKAYENQEYPFEELIEELDIRRDMSRNPLFDVMLVFKNNEEIDYSLNDIRIEYANEKSKIAKLDLTFNIYEFNGKFEIGLEYCTDLFKEESAERILTHYIRILEQITENVERKIREIDAVTEEERTLILKTFNDTKTDYLKDKTVVDLFEEQVEKTPDNTALIFEDKQLTYAQLNRKVNQVAIKLRELGVKPDDFVAIMAERSIEMIVGIYGIIKAGGAYVPIDPNYPRDRIKYMIEECAPKVILVYRAEVKTKIPVINLEEKAVWEGETANLEKVNKPNDLAYCIYTSGTTGKPKGVMVEHKGIINMKSYYENKVAISKEDKILQFANIVFSASVPEMTMAILIGGSLVIVPDSIRLDEQKVQEYAQRNKVTVATLPPNYYMQMNDFQPRIIIIAGSESNGKLIEKTVNSKYINSYGLTENTVCATHWEYKNGEEIPKKIPIGKPISNVQIYILNNNSMCGIGMPGELCIVGAGVARGYLNGPELTAEKFVDNPYGEGKLYRTGDLARWLPDGNIEYLGRIDEQVKIRGFRIELGEIESVLRKIDKVKDTVAIVREDEDKEKSISAYIVSDEEITVSEIRKELEKTLPDYMIPTYMMQIENIPVTRNGKLDKKALPKIKAKSEKEYIASRNDIEEKIVAIFKEILGVEKVGIKDDFFELGGHSLRATRVINRVEVATGVCLSVKNIFENPTVERLSRLVSLEKGEKYKTIPKTEKKDYYMMSSAQKRIYLIQQMGDQGTVYNMPQSLRLRGKVNLEAIKNAMQELINRHEILRTEFLMINGEPVQRIQEYVKADFEFIEDKKTDEADIIDAFIRPFDLEKAPLFRVKLVKREECYLFLIDMNHIISDGMSMGTFMKEFSLLYNENKLEPLTHQYKDYSEWMKTRDLAKQKKYWVNEFKEEIPVLDMPLDYARPKEQSFKGAMIFRKTKKELEEKIKSTAGKTGTTEYMIFLSAAMITLSKYSRQEDIVMGSPISGRTHKDTEGMLGMFVNTLAMRGYPEGTKKYIEFLQEIKESCIKAYENQEYPFEELVEELDIRRDMSRNPLFDVMLVLQNNEEINYSLNDVRIEYVNQKSKIAKFDLTFNIYETDNEVSIGLEYCSDLFKEESAERILTHYVRILEQITENVERKISEIEIVTPEERNLILKNFNNTKTEYPKDKTVVDLFEEQVEKTPKNVALVFENKQLTYAELNRKANQVARKLRKLGVKPDDFVAIIAERSIEMIVGIYGIIKAGGAYVPIAPNYPEDRIKYMLEDCTPKAVLVYKAEMEIEVPVINLEEKAVWEGEETNLEKVNKPNDLVYCIYTSGTTGKPKGVMNRHTGFINRFLWMKNKYQLDDGDVILQKTTYTFDVSVWEIIGWSFIGAKLILLIPDGEKDPLVICNTIERNNVTTIHFVPSMLNVFLLYIENYKELVEKVKSLKFIFTSGEALKREHVDKFNYLIKSSICSCKLANLYGPTEASIDVTYFDCKDNTNIIPIGKPIWNTKIYILDGNSMCGIGVPGELCIAGAGIARGYLNRPELTSEKFVDNPYEEGKLYRSGDLARWLSDGNIEYLGRMDEQVKIRGFRIELGEIESALREIDKVKDAVVIVREDENKEKSINAYIVSDEDITVSEIREELEKMLPDYMVPAYMMQIENIPLTANGKIDKKALPKIEAKSEKEYVAPRNNVEEKIAGIFEEILGVEKVGIKDSFFELGGHSLRATRAINRIEAVTGVCLSVKSIFENPTVEGLSRLVNLEKGEAYEPIPKAEKKDYYTMSSTQKRTYLIQQMGDQGTVYNMPQSLRLIGKVNLDSIKNAMQELINRHEILRTEFLMINGEPVQRIQEYVKADFEFIEDKKTQEADIIDAFIRTFDLGKAPLFRIKLVKREEYYLLLIDMHHIISDGMSMGTFMKEFSLLYNGNMLEPLTHQYKDYSEWMKKRDLAKQKEYWMNEFKEEIPVLDMPLDYSRPKKQSFKGTMIFRKTKKELGKKIKITAGKTGTTEYMIFLSAAMITLSKYSRQEDIIIGSSLSGRTHKDTEGMLGMFVNTLAMRGYPEGTKKYIEFLQEIKESCIKAYENQEYPFEELIEELDIRRDMSRNPLFDVMLVLQNNEEINYSLNDIRIEYANQKSKIAKFDLTLNIYETDNEVGIGLEYCSDLFKEESAERILTHYVRILEQITENMERKIREIDAVTEEERTLILKTFNDTKVDYPKDKTVVDLFEEQVEKTPDNTALVFEDKQLTYTELNRKVNQLARKLRELGVKPDDFVAIMAERSIEMIVGIYGIIKAGGAYVPIDPNYPEDRIKYMLEDCTPKVILVYRADVKTKVPVINLEEKAVWEGETANLEKVNKPKNLAYCIYTSGTTGKPKGVMVEHKGIINMKSYYENKVPISKEDKILQFANIVFDASVSEMTMAILIGGTLVIVPDSIRLDVQKVQKYVQKYKVTVATFPPNYYIQINDFEPRIIITAGSESSGKLIEKTENSKYINAYGPTENTVSATHWEYKNGEEIPKKIPIGKPISNVQIYILNNNSMCGIGIPGELCIAGVGVARGYLNRPELTAEKFVDNPYGEGKLYRTGDLARWLPDGNIEYLGRIDEQVKIRGFRIELGEIESALRKIDKVKDAVVIVREDENKEKSINAYIVSDEEINVSEIREELEKTLPDYMIPAYIMQIENITLTANGKLDKKALPKIEAKSEKEYIAPRNDIEEKVVSVFEEILGVERVGIKDSFFELGGDSIKAIRVVSKMREAGYDILVKDIMKKYTVEAIADSSVLEVERKYEQGEITGTVITTPIIETFEGWKLKKPHHFNQAIMIKVNTDNEREIREVLDALVKHHDVLRSVYRNKKLEILSMIGSRKYDLNVYDLRNENNTQYIVEKECGRLQRSIDLENGPLMKVGLFKTDNGNYMMICIQHLVVDGVSWRILLEDFNTVLTQLKNGEEIVLPRKTASYKDWGEALSEYKNSNILKKEREYWSKVVSNIKDGEIKGDSSCSERGYGNINISFSKSETKDLMYNAGRAFNTEINDLLISALGISVKKLTGQNKVAVVLEGHGREEIHKKIDIDRTVGWFTSMYPIIVECTEDIQESIVSTKEMLRKVPNHGMGYGLLKSEFEKVSADIYFNYLGEMDAENKNSTDYSIGISIAEENRLPGEININGSVIQGQLSFIVTYDRNKYENETIGKFVELYRISLKELVMYCVNQKQTVKTKSDTFANDLESNDLDIINSMF
ncbi:non-ribosomal peptide synthetase [Clostridium felsineum]|uniref:non-ribosomal peptide synthetase n=1 Tax=Clostridium felsineum TaxID=36839 RepID=UPI0020349546|nr:non-ribosomal peptide synthetase [Clostridium felsineum]